MAAAPRTSVVGDKPLAAKATQAPPGTPEKIEVMRTRYAAGQQIFHPKDAVIVWERYTVKDELISFIGLFESYRERFCSRSDAD